MICKGPGLNATALAPLPTVCDLVSTIMYAAGLPVPDHLDGQVIQALFKGEFLAKHPVLVESAISRPTTGQIELNADEEQMVEEKLRGLGYL